MTDLPTSPLLDDDVLKSFAATRQTKEVLAVGKRFVVPIPDLQDGGGPLKLANPKELDMVVRSGSLPDTLKGVTLEGFPQIIPTDGTNVVIINNVTPRQARAIQGLYDDIVAENGGKITRQGMLEFFQTATGISYDELTNSVQLIKDNIGIHGDVYNQPIATFLDRHVNVSTGAPLVASDVQVGYFEKKPSVTRGFFINGKFRHQVGPEAGGTVQHFDNGAMVAIGSDGRVSLIHPNDVDVCYRNPDKSSLWKEPGKIGLPTYNVEDVLHDLHIAAEAPGLPAGPPVPSENIAPPNPYGNLPIPPQLPRFNVSNTTVIPESAPPVPAAGPVGFHVLTLRDDPIDRQNVEELRKHIITLIRNKQIAFSSSNSPGMETVEKEKEAINKAKIVMVVVSSNYVASKEFVELVNYAQAAGKRVVPLISQPTTLKDTPIDNLMGLPRSGQALSNMSQAQKDLAFAGDDKPGIVKEIIRLVEIEAAGSQQNAGSSRYR